MGRELDDRALGLLSSHEFWTAASLADELKVSVRTVRRVLARLAETGVPLESSAGRGGGIRLGIGAGIPRLRLEHREVLNLLLSLAVAETLKSPLLLPGLGAVRQKLGLAFPLAQRKRVSALRSRVLVGAPASRKVSELQSEPSAASIGALQDAFFLQRLLKIVYTDAEGHQTTRTVEPQYLLFNLPVWYVLALDRHKGVARTFRLDRIVCAELQQETFMLVPPQTLMPDVSTYFRKV